MEQKILKSNIFANETLYNEWCEQPVDVEFTLPDYCPDISKILKCKAVARISSKAAVNKNINVDGNVCINVLYADKNSKLCSYEYQYPFSKNLECANDLTVSNIICNPSCEYINCRAVTGRKIDIHGAIGINVKAFKRKNTEIVSDIECENIELKRINTPATVPMGYAEKYLILEEDLSIGQGQQQIEKIIRYDANTCVKESKIIDDKILVKGEMCISILYCATGCDMPQNIKTVIPFSQIVELQGITELCECEAKTELAFLDIKPKNSVLGETKCFAITAKILIGCETYCGNDIVVISDAFSRKYKSEILKENICFEKITDNIKEIFHYKNNLETEENISNVLDIFGDIQNCSSVFEEDYLVIKGNMLVGVVAIDENSCVCYFEKIFEFEYKTQINGKCNTLRCNPQIEITALNFTILSPNTIEIRVDIGINASVYSCEKVMLVTDVKTDEKCLLEKKNQSAMTIYFADNNENVWDIAKHYGSSVEEIMSINGLEEEFLTQSRMILIPII